MMYQNQFEDGVGPEEYYQEGEGEYAAEEDEEEEQEGEHVENSEGDYESDEDENDGVHQNYSYQDPVQEVCTEDE